MITLIVYMQVQHSFLYYVLLFVSITYMFCLLGNIPLRHLVYRVLDLPLSMQPLLYDFGQVTGKTEDDYIRQIVTNHVC